MIDDVTLSIICFIGGRTQIMMSHGQFDYNLELDDSRRRISAAADEKQLEVLRIEYLGRKGRLAALYAGLGTLPKEQKPEAGKKINEFRNVVTKLIEDKKNELAEQGRKQGE